MKKQKFSYLDMKKCAEFWNKKPIEHKYFKMYLREKDDKII